MATSRFRGGRARVLAGAVGVLVLLGADAVYSTLRFRASFQNAACSLKRASNDLERFKVGIADDRLRDAIRDIRSARGYLSHPSMKIAGLLPLLDADLSVLESLTDVAEEAARSGQVGTELAEELGISESSTLGSLYRNGRVDLAALEAAEEALIRSRAHLGTAREVLDGTPKPSLARIRAARSGAAELIDEALSSVDDTRTVLEDLPALLGGEGERNYFLAFQAPSEARGGGGLIGVYGLLRASEGRLKLLDVAPIRELVPRLKGKVSGPDWFEELYGGLDGLGGWREANSSPTFPVTSRILLDMYERSTGDRLDGVMAMDPVVVAHLLRSTGPVTAAGHPTPVDASNASTILMRDIYLDFAGREDEQNEFLRDLVDQIWERLGSGEADAPELADAIGSSIAEDRLKFYSADPGERDAVAVAGLDGDPRAAGSNVQMVFHNNFAANKIDWYLERSQSTTLSIDEQGTGRFVTTMYLRNRAPRGQRSLLKKSDVNELPSGLNLLSLHFMLPEGAEVQEMYSGSTPTEFFEGLEGGRFPTVWAPFRLAVGSRARVSVSYVVPDLVRLKDGRGKLEITFLPQGLVRPDGFELTVRVPEGFRIGKGTSLERSGDLLEQRTLKARITAPGVESRGASDPLGDVCS